MGESGQRHRRLRMRGPNESRDNDSPSTDCQRNSRRVDERVEVMQTFGPYDGKPDEPEYM